MSKAKQGGRFGGRGGPPVKNNGRDGRGRKVPFFLPRQPAIRRGAVEELPTLKYGSTSNYDEFRRELTNYALRNFGNLGHFLRTNEYYVPPAIVQGEAYGEEDIEDPVIHATLMEEVKSRAKEIHDMKANRTRLHAVMMGQLSEESEAKIREHPDYHLCETQNDPLALWRVITSTHVVAATGNAPLDRATAREQYNALRQAPTEHIVHYKERRNASLRAMTATGCALPSEEDQAVDFISGLDDGRYATLKADLYNNAQLGVGAYPATLNDAYRAAINFRVVRYRPQADIVNGVIANPAAVFVATAESPPRHSVDSNNSANGNNTYHHHSGLKKKGTTMTNHPPLRCATGPKQPNVEYVKSGKAAPHFSQQPKRVNSVTVECHACGEAHYARDCPNRELIRQLFKRHQGTTAPNPANIHATIGHDPDETGHHYAFATTTFSQDCRDMTSVATATDCSENLPDSKSTSPENTLCMTARESPTSYVLGPYDVLLDNQATTSVFHQSKLLDNIRESGAEVTFQGITGGIGTSLIGDVPFFGTVKYLPASIANILSMAEVEDRYRIEYEQGSAFVVHVTDHISFRFERKVNNLYVCNMESLVSNIASAHATVAENEALYTKREVDAARRAKQFIKELGYPSMAETMKMIHFGGLVNAPVTVQDIYRAFKIYGLDVPALKGKAKLSTPAIVKPEYVPKPVISSLTMHLDIMFVEGLKFLISVTTPLGLVMTSYLPEGKGVSSVRTALDRHLKEYKARGFQIPIALGDMEKSFSALSTELLAAGTVLNPTGAQQHVPAIEVRIRLVKERVRAILNSLPFKLPRKLVPQLVMFAVSRINLMPSNVRVDSTSPREMFLGRKTDYKKDIRIGFGDYVQVDSLHSTRNDMTPRTLGAISIGPVGNLQGSVRFFLLESESTVVRDKWYSIPMPQSVIDRMNEIACRDKFIVSVENDKQRRLTYRPAPLYERDVEDFAPAADAIVDPPVIMSGTHTADDPDHMADILVPRHQPTVEDALNPQSPVTHEPLEITSQSNQPHVPASEASQPPPVHDIPLSAIEQAAVTSRYNTRYRGARIPPTREQIHFCFNVSVKRAIAKFGDLAVKAIEDELRQMIEKRVWQPILQQDLNQQQLRTIIRSHMFLKEKRDSDGSFVKIKARLVAGGDLQVRELYPNVSSPTVGLAAVFMVATIAAGEQRHVVTIDIAGAYLNADIKDHVVLMRLEPKLADLLVAMEPATYSAARNHDGSVIVQLLKALYGCIESAKLWYDVLSATLREYGFTENPHDRCVFNLITPTGKQLTVVVYVDDLFITCTDITSVDQFVAFIKQKFVTITEHRGPVHSYLGMTFDYTTTGRVSVSMNGYINDVLSFTSVTGSVTSPATSNLFTTAQTSEADLLQSDDKEDYHTVVAKLLYLAKRVRPDILTAVSLLASKVINPTAGDRQKLYRVLKYLNGSKELGIILEQEHDFPVAYVDASYGVHSDCKSQTGLYITLGKGPIFVRSSKQKLVAKSSTEAELIALSDSVGEIIWTRNFLLGQGLNTSQQPANIFEDNMSTISLIEKGRSHNPATKHINIRYFFLKDRIDNNEVKIKYKPTHDMIADILTKPLQGTLFKTIRALLLNESVNR